MYSVSSASYGDIGSRVDEEAGRQFRIRGSRWGTVANGTECCAGQSLEFASGKLLLAQLDEVNPATRRLCDLRKQTALAGVFVTGKLGATGNVAEQQDF
jgi:hypothetical protein